MRPPLAAALSLALFLVVSLSGARGAEPFFKKGDVIALVGGEDMVVASEYGFLELLLVRALPDYRLRFRNLAWEGDTVFEQRRDLNFPTWEEQLDQIGATVVIAQFGQMESFAGKEKLPEFIAAYEKLIERFTGSGKRRVVVASPSRFDDSYQSLLPSANRLYNPDPEMMRARQKVLEDYVEATRRFAQTKQCTFVDLTFSGIVDGCIHRDGVHLLEYAHANAADNFCASLSKGLDVAVKKLPPEIFQPDYPIRQLIIAKNRLWFDYWRPQNWAFLAGDRTAQPSSRDHLDPSKRWFPPEREAFLPLIEAKEKEIDALAQSLASAEKK
jgi:hypothetical protein